MKNKQHLVIKITLVTFITKKVMKNLMYLVLALFLFAGCEKKPEQNYLNGLWTLHLSNPTGNDVSWHVCFEIDDIINDEINLKSEVYFYNESGCIDTDSNHLLKYFDFRCYDTTLLVKVKINYSDDYGGDYMYYGKYDKDKDVFVGATNYVYPDKQGAYYMCSNNDSITRGMMCR